MNDVLLSINVYWSQIFILPKAVLKKINLICRAFLWTGTCNSPKPGYVSWNEVCKPITYGGLGFRSLVAWNVAFIGKLVWGISMKADNLWIKWIHDRYIKNQNWLTFNAPSTASWAVNYICKAKQLLINNVCGSDLFTKPKFSIAETYRLMHGQGNKIHWCKAIWNHHNVPKHSFVGWLAMRNKLQTKSKLAGLGICGMNSCLLCENAVEDHNHLFFQCEYNKQCLAKVKNWLGIRAMTCNLPQLISWIQRRYKGGKFRRKVVVAGILATVYKIWKERNNAL